MQGADNFFYGLFILVDLLVMKTDLHKSAVSQRTPQITRVKLTNSYLQVKHWRETMYWIIRTQPEVGLLTELRRKRIDRGCW